MIIARAAQNWYDEVTQPGFDTENISPFTFDYGTGHYSQVVWADTEELGCGMVHYQVRKEENGEYAGNMWLNCGEHMEVDGLHNDRAGRELLRDPRDV